MKKVSQLEADLLQQVKDKKAKSNAKQCEIPSALIPNLVLVSYSKSASWVYRYKDPMTGNWTSTTVGYAPVDPLADVMVRVSNLQDDILDGRSPRSSEVKLSHYFDDSYYPSIQKNKRSACDDRSRFDCHIREALGRMPLSAIRVHHLKELIHQLPPHLSGSTKDRIAALLKAICKHAFDAGLLKTNPAAGLKLSNAKNPRQRVASAAEIRALCAPTVAEANPLPRLLNRFLFATAMRLSEALTAKFADVNWEARFLCLSTTKSGKPRMVPLSDEAMDVLNELSALRRNEYLFPGRFGGHMARPSRALNRMLNQAGIAGLCYHDMRRTACSIALNADVPLLDASRLLGHSNTSVTQTHYAVLHGDRLHAAAAKISDALRAANGAG